MKEYKNPCVLDKINTTSGERWLVVTYSKSKTFKTFKGAKKWIINNNYKVVKRLNLD